MTHVDVLDGDWLCSGVLYAAFEVFRRFFLIKIAKDRSVLLFTDRHCLEVFLLT